MDWLKYFDSHRPWTKAETEKLFKGRQVNNFNSADFKRSEKECICHWVDVLKAALQYRDKSLAESIRINVANFHEYLKAGGTVETSTQIPIPDFPQDEAELMVTQFIIDKRPLNTGLERLLQECETYFQGLIIWIAIQRNYPSEEHFISALIDVYYKQSSDNRRQKREKQD
jgi:hypothetical protein